MFFKITLSLSFLIMYLIEKINVLHYENQMDLSQPFVFIHLGPHVIAINYTNQCATYQYML